METVMGLIVGVGLSAACGFRVFVPLLGMSIANMAGHLTLASGFEWIGSWPALIAFGTATLLEIGTYYIPWIDNLMDVLATPAAIIAGIIATASQIGEMSPLLQWSLAAVAGGGIGAVVQGGMVAVRAGSSGTTGGFGNVIVSTVEWVAASVVTFLAIVLPVVCFLVVIGICYKMFRKILQSRWLQRSLLAGQTTLADEPPAGDIERPSVRGNGPTSSEAGGALDRPR